MMFEMLIYPRLDYWYRQPFLSSLSSQSILLPLYLLHKLLDFECEPKNVLGFEGQKWKDNVYNPYS